MARRGPPLSLRRAAERLAFRRGTEEAERDRGGDHHPGQSKAAYFFRSAAVSMHLSGALTALTLVQLIVRVVPSTE